MKRIELTEKEMHCLYDLQYMISDETWDTLKLNKMDKVITKFFNRLEKEVVPELTETKNETNNMSKM